MHQLSVSARRIWSDSICGGFNVTQDVTQDVTQGKDLDQWIEHQITANPKITTDELAELSGKTSRTIKRHLAKLPHIRFIGSGYSGHWEIDKK